MAKKKTKSKSVKTKKSKSKSKTRTIKRKTKKVYVKHETVILEEPIITDTPITVDDVTITTIQDADSADTNVEPEAPADL